MQPRSTYRQPTLKVLLGVAFLLFAATAAVHIVCGDFPKAIDVLPDERRYLDIARSLFSGNGLIMRGEPSDFQKILYPLSLFPALLFPDGQTQIRVVGILNSLYAASTVFPVLLIARKLFRRTMPIIVSMVFAVLLPDLMYSMTFMTESIFIPISLWMAYLCWCCFESGDPTRKSQSPYPRELVLATCAGALCYLVYLCKEVAWMYLIAFIAWYIVAAIRRRRSIGRAFAASALFAAGFLIPFLVMKLTLFAGLFNSYSQLSFDILLSPYTVLFGLYSIATDAVYFIVGFGVFPVLFTALTWRSFSRADRDLLFFCLASLLIGLAVVVFTISMREDVGHVALRQHLRYVIPLFIPLLMLFIKQIGRFDPGALRTSPRSRGIAVGATAAFCLLVIGFFGSANLSQGFDNSQFHFLRWLLDQVEPLSQEYFDSWSQSIMPIATDDGALLVIDPIDWLCRFAIVAFTMVGMWLLMSRKASVRRNMGRAICCIIAAFMVANTVCAYQYNRNAYSVKQDEIDEICAISDYLADREEGSQVVVVLDEANTGPNNLIDTYLQDGAGAYRYVVIDDFRTEQSEGGGAGSASTAASNAASTAASNAASTSASSSGAGSPTYILANTSQRVGIDAAYQVSVGDDDGEDRGRFQLYRV